MPVFRDPAESLMQLLTKSDRGKALLERLSSIMQTAVPTPFEGMDYLAGFQTKREPTTVADIAGAIPQGDVMGLYGVVPGVVTAPVKAARRAALLSKLPAEMQSFEKGFGRTVKTTPAQATEFIKSLLSEPVPKSREIYTRAGEMRPVRRPSDWGERLEPYFRREVGEGPAVSLRGKAMSRKGLPEVLYHVTTAKTPVIESGALKGRNVAQRGLGGYIPGGAESISFTTDRNAALNIRRELERTVKIARGKASPKDVVQWASEDLKKTANAGTLKVGPEEWYSYLLDELRVRGFDPTSSITPSDWNSINELEAAYRAYRIGRERHGGDVDPVMMAGLREYAKVDPKDISIVAVNPKDIPEGTYVRAGNDVYQKEVAVHAEVPVSRAKYFPYGGKK